MFAARAPSRLTRLCSLQCRRRLATAASDKVRIIEVGPRDGLQNEKKSIPLATKVELTERLAHTGVPVIEAASFVAPKWVPQMASSAEVMEHVLRQPPPSPVPVLYQFLCPNQKGMDNFFKVLDSAPLTPPPSPSSTSSKQDKPEVELSIFTAATESFTRKNTNCSMAESLERFKPIFSTAKARNIGVRAYISVALGCPYEGPNVDPHAVANLAVTLLEMGANEISVADTTGMGTVPRTKKLLETLSQAGVRAEDIALHFHDTYAQALPNTIVGLEHGVRSYDTAVGGLGGCPYSPGATGNVATEDMVHMLHSLGLDTGVDMQRMAEIGEWINAELGKANESRAGKAFLAQRKAAGKA
ncbi:hydroxymethylglutaryl-CoA lyase [Rhizodiscina lignyota]|uniref:hydroxymethylglutaryl-CoA lyase n=1 Tax=Rhizodiscina lignyota TaxID=1504668 RepID=A0A9P4I4I5_9PEZI|nr:hydroxymethylglutaryl-CoA lyase [Rhizodiscina lignyota]